jgi:endonuclease-8
MPEGDTIWRLARWLQNDITGKICRQLTLPGYEQALELAGEPVRRVDSLGKHLLVGIGQSAVLHVHLGLFGRYRQRRPSADCGPLDASLRLDDALLVFGSPKIAQLLDARQLAKHPLLTSLGPDLLAPTLDLHRIIERRARVDSDLPIGELLLDQRVACGFGNVYRCELLFIARLSPTRPHGMLSVENLAELWRLGRELMQRNLQSPKRQKRVTVPSQLMARHPERPRYWVYRRSERPCLRCKTAIVCTSDSRARPLFYCPTCQV